jgi:Ca2+-binding RTX toxin-like protein
MFNQNCGSSLAAFAALTFAFLACSSDGAEDSSALEADDSFATGDPSGLSSLAQPLAACVPGESPVNVQFSEGTDGNDTIGGSGNDDFLSGGDCDDEIFGEAGDDALAGNAGNDRIDGGSNNDSIRGGPGDDTLFGDIGADAMAGGAGDDKILGGGGDDVLVGGEGADRLDGEAGCDVCFGDADDDIRNCEAIAIDGQFIVGDFFTCSAPAPMTAVVTALGEPGVLPPF